jgi:glycosyltransferase involved in cell wall biosynthesis
VILKAAKKHGVPVRIAHSHNSNQDKNLKYLIKLYYRRQIPKYASDLFACGKDAGDWMFRGEPYTVMNNAIDSKQYVPNLQKRLSVRKMLGIPEDTFVLGHVGRFFPQKNHTFLLDIFAELKRLKEDAVLLLVGDGELRAEIEQKVKDLNLTENVIFTGVRSDVPDLMQAMDCFVFPSIYEGLPLTLVEAQASGLPCIVSDRVPIESKLTDLLIQVPLELGVERWADAVVRHAALGRKITLEQIRLAGYDIKACAEDLQRYYLGQKRG